MGSHGESWRVRESHVPVLVKACEQSEGYTNIQMGRRERERERSSASSGSMVTKQKATSCLWSSLMLALALVSTVLPRGVEGSSEAAYNYKPTVEDGFLVDDAAVEAFAQVIQESGGAFDGSVEIGVNVTSLKGLENLTRVEGYLQIRRNAGLTSLAGLENLTRVDGDITVRYNNAIASLGGLEGLRSVGAYVSINENNQLTSLAGLESLTRVDGDITVRYNNAIASPGGLESLTSVGGYFIIGYNKNLTSL